jgi:hypothetical protein
VGAAKTAGPYLSLISLGRVCHLPLPPHCALSGPAMPGGFYEGINVELACLMSSPLLMPGGSVTVKWSWIIGMTPSPLRG